MSFYDSYNSFAASDPSPLSGFINAVGGAANNLQETLGLKPTHDIYPHSGHFDFSKWKNTPNAHQNMMRNHPGLQSGEAIRPGGRATTDDHSAFSDYHSHSPSGCQNCNYGDISCYISKAGCEAQHAVGGGGLGKYLPIILLGGGIILAAIIIKKFR